MRSVREIQHRLATVKARRQLFLQYANDRLSDGDLHGMADAAMDLREIEQEIETLEWVLEEAEIT